MKLDYDLFPSVIFSTLVDDSGNCSISCFVRGVGRGDNAISAGKIRCSFLYSARKTKGADMVNCKQGFALDVILQNLTLCNPCLKNVPLFSHKA